MSTIIERLASSLHSEGRIARYNNTKTELVIRCVYCGDSIKNSHHAHFFIATHPPFPFYCQRCNTKGILDGQTLRDIQIDDIELLIDIRKENRKVLKEFSIKSTNSISLLDGHKKLVIPPYDKEHPKIQPCIDYLNQRIGVNFTLEMLNKIKLIYSYKQLIKLNKLENIIKVYKTKNNFRDKVDLINDTAIGFLSLDNNFINFRFMQNHPKGFRYSNESLNYPYNIGKHIYALRNSIDLLSPKLHVVLTEGIFDIISVHYNLYKGISLPNQVFMASNGKGFNNVFSVLRSSGFLNIELDLYSDKDVDLNVYRKILNFDWFDKITIHYNVNEGEKDFGVPLERIKIKSYILKR